MEFSLRLLVRRSLGEGGCVPRFRWGHALREIAPNPVNPVEYSEMLKWQRDDPVMDLRGMATAG